MYGIYIIKLLSLATLAGIAFIVFMLIMFFLNKRLGKSNFFNKIYFIFKNNAVLFVLLISGFGVIASLFFSEIMHYLPCELCWYQRIFIYPLPILCIIALIKKSKDIIDYLLALALVALVIGVYQYMLQFGKVTDIVNCGIEAGLPSCSNYYILQFGFITIPFMGIVSMLMILILLIISRKNK